MQLRLRPRHGNSRGSIYPGSTLPKSWRSGLSHWHMMIANVKGHFSKTSGVLTLDKSNLANSRVEASIEAASIETRDGQRDAHLKSADFFDVEKFPTLHFKSTGISIVGDGKLSVEGDLTI